LDTVLDFGARLLGITLEAALFLGIGALASGLLDAFLTPADLARLPRRAPLAALVGGLLGLALPVGEIGAVPVARRLLRRGAGVPLAVAFLLAAPVVNVIALAASAAALGERAPALIPLRAAVALGVAISVGLLSAVWPHAGRVPAAAPPTASDSGLRHALHAALADLRAFAPWLLLGALLAAATQTLLASSALDRWADSALKSVLVMQARGFAGAVTGPRDLWVARDWADTYPSGALLGFLTLGALLDLKTVVLLARAVRPRALLALLALTFLATTVIACALTASASVTATGAAGAEGVRGADPVRVRFSLPMQPDSAADRFQIEPPIAGAIAWEDARTLVFTPAEPWQAGSSYTLTVGAGARSARGPTLGAPLRWTFAARLPRVVTLAPADAFQRNLIAVDLETGVTRALTAAPSGIEDFAVSPSGSQIAYTRDNDDGTSDIWLLEVAGGATRPVTRCVDALCSAPAWSPDESELAYQRLDFNTGQHAAGGQSRVWRVDLATLETRLLFDDPQILGAAPAWSPDGARITVFDAAAPGIRVHALRGGVDLIIPSVEGGAGAFSPDGARLVYPLIMQGALRGQFYTHLEIADLVTGARVSLSGDADAPVDDGAAAWPPQGDALVVARRALDQSFTPGKQLYRLDAATGEAAPLVVDPAYTHAGMHWDPSGRFLIFQRFPVDDLDGQPSVWLYDATTGGIVRVADNAFLPAWLP